MEVGAEAVCAAYMNQAGRIRYIVGERIRGHASFEIFTAVTIKDGVFWDVTPCGSFKNRRFGGT
jgi:hypothetical protein